MKKIHDEFTGLEMSRAQKWQLRKRKQNLCVTCGKPAVTKVYCLEHAVVARERARQRKRPSRRNHSLTYFLEMYDKPKHSK